jgi:hypothetical protein
MQKEKLTINKDLILDPWEHYGSYWARYEKDNFKLDNNRVCIFYLHKPPRIYFFDQLHIFEQSFLSQLDKQYDKNQLEELKDRIDQFLIKVSQLQSFI